MWSSVSRLPTKHLRPADVEPLSLDCYLSHAQWFQEQKATEATPSMVRRLDCSEGIRLVMGQPTVDAMITNPGWFRNLSPEEKDAVNRRLWAEGRLILDPGWDRESTTRTPSGCGRNRRSWHAVSCRTANSSCESPIGGEGGHACAGKRLPSCCGCD
jgi:hypothetical protein